MGALTERLAALKKGDTSAREALLEELLDQHGPGRVMSRNTRPAIKGFPKRKVHLVSLDEEPRLAAERGVRFDLKDRDSVEREALRMAVQDARRRADAAASGAGVAIERIMRIEEQRDVVDVPRPLPMNMVVMESRAAQGPVPLEAGENWTLTEQVWPAGKFAA